MTAARPRAAYPVPVRHEPFYQETLTHRGLHGAGVVPPRPRASWRVDGRIVAGLVHIGPNFLGPLFVVSLLISLIAHGDHRTLVVNSKDGTWRFTLKAAMVLAVAVFGPLLAGRTDLIENAALSVVGVWAATNLLAALWTWATGRTFRYPLHGLRLWPRGWRRSSR
ncbi:hypothetical protein N802_09395 [Knoellia sinensis KCTC 19936]|uniref:Uncharacterized protein n=1 Tax=Knoellia sinensis KCTC 19936 TaxID=1385520 RepID=A0A0A0IYP4_9MICO|nr:hypothetical protein [Knoellia sinensis]KGN30330.1 hypothetical protein N802_09395 [Knoellia sinensis KCTC 19936]